MDNEKVILNDFEKKLIKSKYPDNIFSFYDYSTETEIVCFCADSLKLIGIVSSVDWNDNKKKHSIEFLLSEINNYIESAAKKH